MMIFAHAVIPHNHIDADHRVHPGFIHLSHHHSESDECPKFRELCEDFQSCKISDLLFKKFNAEENILLTGNAIIIDVIRPSDHLLMKANQFLPRGIAQNPIPSRAPPAIC